MPKSENYMVIQGWMVSELGLKGNELLTYALIYGFSQDGESEFRGSASYIADWLSTSRQTVVKTLASLVEKGLLHKNSIEINKVIFNTYKTLHPVKKVDTPCQETLQPPCKETLHNNNSINNPNNINSKAKAHPTREQVREYCSERGNSVDPDKWFDYYEANGWKVGKNPMKDWKAAVRTWERNGFDQKKPQQKAQVQNRFNNYQQSGTDYDALLGRMYS